VTRLLALSWGLLVAAPLAARARVVALSDRVDALRAVPRVGARVRARARLTRAIPLPTRARALARVATSVAVAVSARRQRRALDAALSRELPVVVDLLGVAVSAGCTPYLAVDVVARWGPRLAAAHFASARRACDLGLGLDRALDDITSRAPKLRSIVDVLSASERLGAPVGPQLARVADEARAALRRAAEADARRAPVRLLFPLVFLVLPAFVLLTVVPGLVAGLSRL
jgi:hypothetical protein